MRDTYLKSSLLPTPQTTNNKQQTLSRNSSHTSDIMLTTRHTAVMAKMALCHISIHTITPAATLPLLRTAGHVYTFKQHQTFTSNARRQFSTAKTLPFEFFSSKRSQETKGNVQPVTEHSEPAWPHPVYTEKQANDIVCVDFYRELS